MSKERTLNWFRDRNCNPLWMADVLKGEHETIRAVVESGRNPALSLWALLLNDIVSPSEVESFTRHVAFNLFELSRLKGRKYASCASNAAHALVCFFAREVETHEKDRIFAFNLVMLAAETAPRCGQGDSLGDDILLNNLEWLLANSKPSYPDESNK